jgi:hypothetical protein
MGAVVTTISGIDYIANKEGLSRRNSCRLMFLCQGAKENSPAALIINKLHNDLSLVKIVQLRIF